MARFKLQRTAATILPEQRVKHCLWTIAEGGDHVRVLSRDSKARFGNLQTCGSVWHCPVCSAKVSETRRRELNEALLWARKQTADGLPIIPVMITLTASHKAEDSLAEQLDGLKRAKQKLRQSKDWKALKRSLAGTITATEVTHGRNGWHTHFHELLFVLTGTEADAIALVEPLRARWLRSLELVGMSGSEDAAFDASGASKAGQYVAKFGAGDSYGIAKCDTPGQGHWGAAEELTRAHSKTGKGSHPFQLLEAAQNGDKRARALFREYGIAFKGRRQLTWSPHFKDAVGIGEVEDQQAAKVIEDELKDTLIARIAGNDWGAVKRSPITRAEILRAAEQMGAVGVEALITRARQLAAPVTASSKETDQ